AEPDVQPSVTLRLVFPPEDRDRQAVERLIGRLRHDGVHDLVLRVLPNPRGNLLPQVLPLLRHRRREDLHTVETGRRVVLVLWHRSFCFLTEAKLRCAARTSLPYSSDSTTTAIP